MLDQLQRSPAGWQAAGPQVFVRQAVDLSDDRRSVVVQVTEQQFLRIAELAARFMRCTSHGDRLCPAVGGPSSPLDCTNRERGHEPVQEDSIGTPVLTTFSADGEMNASAFCERFVSQRRWGRPFSA
jgi:hypothetical protein